jgi:pyrroline-5-carboxylate reductase
MMAEAIMSGMLSGGFSASDIEGADPDVRRGEYIAKKYGVRISTDNREPAARCDVLLMAVKPQYFPGVVQSLSPALSPGHRIVSIMAGVTTDTIEKELRCHAEPDRILPVVRVMPNTPAMVRAGITCVCAGKTAAEQDVEFAKKIFLTVGSVVDVDERLMDAATGVAGCGPAYIYMVIEALADGGVMMGLPRGLSQKLAAGMVKGAAEMVLADMGHPGQLKDNVCSPGGATIEGVYTLERAGLRGAYMEAVKAGTEKCGNIK